MTTKIPTMDAGMNRAYIDVAPTSAMPELPGVRGIIIRIARMSWITKDSRNQGRLPQTKKDERGSNNLRDPVEKGKQHPP